MDRIVIAGAVFLVVLVVAAIMRRRAPGVPTQPAARLPAQLIRDDFANPDRPWLVAVFTSRTCDSCGPATDRARLLESTEVAYEEIPWQDKKDLHDRYGVTAVPSTLIADADGVVHRSFVGAPDSGELWGAVAELRDSAAGQS